MLNTKIQTMILSTLSTDSKCNGMNMSREWTKIDKGTYTAIQEAKMACQR